MIEKREKGLGRQTLQCVACGVVTYGILFLVTYLSDFLGRSPVLDARENLAWAERIANGDLPKEPIYRALLYPALLSILPLTKLVAPALGLGCHFVNSLLCGVIARYIWKARSAAILTALVYSVYPVALYFSVQILDITFGLTLFLSGIAAFYIWSERQARKWLVIAGACAGLAVLARPNFLPSVVIMPFLVLIIGWGWRRSIVLLLADALLLGVMIVGCLFAQGYLSWCLSGDFRILPWQGAYNFYAANKEGANGKFYQQSIVFDSIPDGMNPARMESEYLYCAKVEVEENAELDVGDMEQYWRTRLIADIEAAPIRWLSLMSRKAAYLANDWEQYNNLTYAYHKARFAALTWNPLGWGMLLIGAIVSLFFNRRWWLKPELWALLALASFYAAGVLLFYASARFRLPLAPICCILLGGGALGSLARFRESGLKSVVLLLTLCLGAGVVAYGEWFGARDQSSFIQDELLLAGAAAEVGDDDAAVKWADLVLCRDFSRDDARHIQLIALYNLWTRDGLALPEEEYALRVKASLRALENQNATTAFIAGVYHWIDGAHEKAVNIWTNAVEQHASSAVSSARALQAVGHDGKFPEKDPRVLALKALLID